MNYSVRASAPGKAIISGEYAVLRGGAAISLALDCRATVSLVPSPNACHSVVMPGLAAGRWSFERAPGGDCRWQELPPAGGRALVEAALSFVDELPFMDIEIDTRRFFDRQSGRKLGLGSSAAAMTALVGALQKVSAVNQPAIGIAARAHANLQGGRGSGVDIASSYHGGVIEFRNKPFQVQERRWPSGLLCKLLWSGTPADTASRIAALDETGSTASGWEQLCQAADQSAAFWQEGGATGVLHGLARFCNALHAFSEANRLQVFAAGHNELVTLAESRQLVYKPCGAGGGDVGMVFGTDENAIAAFCQDAVTGGFETLPFVRDERGMALSTGDDRD